MMTYHRTIHEFASYLGAELDAGQYAHNYPHGQILFEFLDYKKYLDKIRRSYALLERI
ncbi:hypothetical protein GCM10008934_30250 [Virgibacillus salarius]